METRPFRSLRSTVTRVSVALVCWPPCRARAATGRPVRNPLILACSCGILALAGGGGTALAGELHGYATVATDYVFRGVSQSNEEPTVQAGLDYTHADGYFLGLFAATIDYPTTPFRPDPGQVELDAYLGFGRALGRDFAWDVELIHYQFPDSEADDDAYQELGANLRYRDVARFGVTFSDDARTLGSSAWTAELELRHQFGDRFQLSGTLGRYAFARSIWRDYLYWDVGLSAVTGPLTFDFRYFDTSDEAQSFAGPRLTRGRVVASLSIGF